MARFVRIPKKAGEVCFVNVDHVQVVAYTKPTETDGLHTVGLANTSLPNKLIAKAEFDTKEEALKWIDLNFCNTNS